MELVSDILLGAAAISAAVYCLVLGKRLKKFTNLEQGVGGAVALMNTQVQDLKYALDKAHTVAAESVSKLNETNERAESVSKRLEIQLAALNDVQIDSINDKEGGARFPDSEPMFMRSGAGDRQ